MRFVQNHLLRKRDFPHMCNLSNVSKALQVTFGEAAMEANEQTQVVKRRRRFDPISLAQSFVLAFLAKPKANSEDVATMAATLGVSVSPQAVQQRYGPALNKFFEALFHRMLRIVVHSEQALAPILERFTEVRLIDSSVIALPVSQADQYRGCGVKGGLLKSALKLQTELDLRTGQIESIAIEPGKLPDQGTDRQHIKPIEGSLRITDLGYFNLAVFAMIAAAKAFYLSRTQYTVSVTDSEVRTSLIDWLNEQACGTVDKWVQIGTQNVLACRLIAWRVPPEVASTRRRKMRQAMKDRGRHLSAKALASCDWEYLVTNLKADQLSFNEAIILYRSRWQIELLFKRWKSYCKIDLLDGGADEITMTRLWIRLCAALIQHWLIVAIAWPKSRTMSFAKLAKLLCRMAWEIAGGLQSQRQLRLVLQRVQRQTSVACRRTKSKKRPSTQELLHNPDLLEYALT